MARRGPLRRKRADAISSSLPEPKPYVDDTVQSILTEEQFSPIMADSPIALDGVLSSLVDQFEVIPTARVISTPSRLSHQYLAAVTKRSAIAATTSQTGLINCHSD